MNSRHQLLIECIFGVMPTEKSANVNLQKEGMLKVKFVGIFVAMQQCHVFATTLTKVLVQRKQMDDLSRV